jgi:hypothetical protein
MTAHIASASASMEETTRRLISASISGAKRTWKVWDYCLMPNHVHLILNPRQADGLGRAVLDRMPHFAELLSTTQDQDFGDLRLAEGSGRPLGTAELSPFLNDCSADPSHAELQDANPRPASPANNRNCRNRW